MNWLYKLLLILQTEMTRPTPYGWFHLLWVFLTIISIVIIHNKKSEKSLKIVLGTYGIIALILELLKQLSWSFNYDNGIVTWDYEWYAFPFQLCTTPIYISIICLFLKDGKLRNKLLSYLAYITILGSIATFIKPDSCFVKDILINIHTMYLHCGSLVVSVYLLTSGWIKPNLMNYINAIKVFIVLILIADISNCVIYNIGILNGETFNMFYISPYFISSLPIFDIIQQKVPYMIYLLIYFIAFSLGAYIIYQIQNIVAKKVIKNEEKNN